MKTITINGVTYEEMNVTVPLNVNNMPRKTKKKAKKLMSNLSKSITTLLLLIALIGKSQTLSNVTVYSVIPDTVQVGDSITIKFKVHYPYTNMFKIQLWTSTYLQDCLNDYAGFWYADTSIVKVKILPIMGNGKARIYSNYSPYKSFYISSTVGIEELNKYNIVNVKYYDIYGKEKPLQNERLSIKITTYSNGYQKSEKIILFPQ